MVRKLILAYPEIFNNRNAFDLDARLETVSHQIWEDLKFSAKNSSENERDSFLVSGFGEIA